MWNTYTKFNTKKQQLVHQKVPQGSYDIVKLLALDAPDVQCPGIIWLGHPQVYLQVKDSHIPDTSQYSGLVPYGTEMYKTACTEILGIKWYHMA